MWLRNRIRSTFHFYSLYLVDFPPCFFSASFSIGGTSSYQYHNNLRKLGSYTEPTYLIPSVSHYLFCNF